MHRGSGWPSERVRREELPVTIGGARTRVASLSLWGRHGPAEDRGTQVAGTLAELWPDVVCLQDVWRKGDITQADVIARDLGMQPSFSPTRMSAAAVTGIAVLGRWPVAAQRRHVLPGGQGAAADTVALSVTFEHPSGPLHVTTAVLDWEPDHSAARVAQSQALGAVLAAAALDGTPPVIAAVVNAQPGTPESATLGAVVRDTRAAAGTGSCPAGRILVRPGTPRQPVMVHAAWLASVAEGQDADHCAAVTDLSWPRGPLFEGGCHESG
jgi:endonuclease/exonuclease/phosphatase family metal-dependent hydrolase